MQKQLKFDYIVLGSGIVSVCLVNMLIQAGKRVLVIRVRDFWNLNMASMQNQGIGCTGLPWYHDRSDVVLEDFHRSFNFIKNAMGFKFENNRSFCIMSKEQLSAYSKKAKDNTDKFAEYGFPLLVPENGKLESNFINRYLDGKDTTAIPILDSAFKIDRFMNMIEGWSIEFGNSHRNKSKDDKYGEVIYREIDNQSDVSLKDLGSGEAAISIGSDKLTAENIVLCTGTGTFNLLNPLFNNQIDRYNFNDQSTFGGKSFQFAIERMPVLTINMPIYRENVVFNLKNLDAFVKHPNNHIIYTTTSDKVVPSPINITGEICKDGDSGSITKLKNYFTESYNLAKNDYEVVRESHCNKLIKTHNGLPSISSFVQRLSEYNNVILALPGKASIAVTAAEQVLKLNGLTSLEIKLGAPELIYKHILIN